MFHSLPMVQHTHTHTLTNLHTYYSDRLALTHAVFAASGGRMCDVVIITSVYVRNSVRACVCVCVFDRSCVQVFPW